MPRYSFVSRRTHLVSALRTAIAPEITAINAAILGVAIA